MIRREQLSMPADVRARRVLVEEHPAALWTSYRIVKEPTRGQRVVQRVAAVMTLVFAFVFAFAAVALAASADPVICIVPLAVAAFMGWCAREIWPARRSHYVWITPRRDRHVGVGRIDPHAESAPVGKAPAAIDL